MITQETISDPLGYPDGAEVMANEPDETLMSRVGTGDHAACRELVERHLGLLIRIKNQLTLSQQEKLRALRPTRPGPPSFRHGPEDRGP